MFVKNRVLIIAEAGVNHNGSTALGKQLVDAAAEAGADLVKFQTFNAESLATHSTQSRISNTDDGRGAIAVCDAPPVGINRRDA